MTPMSSEYITGITILDEQHEQLFQLTQQAKALLKNENMLYKYDELQKILKGLRDYTLSHFVTEEDYMEKAGYAKLDAHRQLHLRFIDKLNQFEEEVTRISLGTQDTILAELWDYLADWLMQHISNIDIEMISEIEAAR